MIALDLFQGDSLYIVEFQHDTSPIGDDFVFYPFPSILSKSKFLFNRLKSPTIMAPEMSRPNEIEVSSVVS